MSEWQSLGPILDRSRKNENPKDAAKEQALTAKDRKDLEKNHELSDNEQHTYETGEWI